MDAFTPPTPPLPPVPVPPLPAAAERRAPPMLSSVTDVFSTTTNTAPRPEVSKPLPPGPVPRYSEKLEDQPKIVIKKPRALPAIPVSPNATKRRSMSVGNAGDQLTAPPMPVANFVTDHRPKEKAEWEGLLDVFKGELSTLDPVSPASLDLRDPSTPARQISHRSRTKGLVLSPCEIQDGGDSGGERDESVKSSAAVFQRIEQEDGAAPVAIIPPRSSSLQSPIGSGLPHTASSRQVNNTLTPLRSRSGPSMVAISASPSKHLRVLPSSTASSSEPSLVPTLDEGRICE